MTSPSKTIGYLIGRFNPLQNGHRALLQEVADNNDHMVVLVGSATESRTLKNPLSFEERKSVLLSLFPKATVLPLPDLPDDDEWVKLLSHTLRVGIDSLRVEGAAQVRMYSADATRADDYALRCAWVQEMGHEVVPFKPVTTPTDLSASLVRDQWYNSRYEDVAAMVPAPTLELLQRLDLGWMKSPYVKKATPGEFGPQNSVFVAFWAPGTTADEPPLLGHIARTTGDMGFVGGRVDAGESLVEALHRECREEIGLVLTHERSRLLCTHWMSQGSRVQHTHLYVCEVSRQEMYALRRGSVDAAHAESELAAFCVTPLTPRSVDTLLGQRWAGTALQELQTLIYTQQPRT